jgi:hypothetical protein
MVIFILPPSSSYGHGSLPASFQADATLPASFRIDMMGFLLRSHDGFLRADLGTGAASIALVLSNKIPDQILTYPRRTFLIPDMGEIFFGEIFKGGQ